MESPSGCQQLAHRKPGTTCLQSPSTLQVPPRCGSHRDALQPAFAFSSRDQTTQSISKAEFPQESIAKPAWSKSSREGSYYGVVLRNQAWDKAQRHTEEFTEAAHGSQHKPIKLRPLAGEVLRRGGSVPSRQTPHSSCTAVPNLKDR